MLHYENSNNSFCSGNTVGMAACGPNENPIIEGDIEVEINGDDLHSWYVSSSEYTEHSGGGGDLMLVLDQTGSNKSIDIQLGTSTQPWNLNTGTWQDTSAMFDISYSTFSDQYNIMDFAELTVHDMDQTEQKFSGSFKFIVDSTAGPEGIGTMDDVHFTIQD